jgi:hypothetical protein
MPALITHHLVPVIALSIQVLVFVYLYTSHRVRFFRYLIYAWGFLSSIRAPILCCIWCRRCPR